MKIYCTVYILTNEKYTYRQMKNILTDKWKIYIPTNETMYLLATEKYTNRKWKICELANKKQLTDKWKIYLPTNEKYTYRQKKNIQTWQMKNMLTSKLKIQARHMKNILSGKWKRYTNRQRKLHMTYRQIKNVAAND